MKKLMIAAAVAAMTAGAFAACSVDDEDTTCATVFELKASGKISGAKSTKVDYKVNKSLSAKGYLLIDAEYTAEALVAFKYKGVKYAADIEDGEVIEFAAYGKNTDLFNSEAFKPGKSYKLEADLGVVFDEADVGDAGLTLVMSTFGKIKAKVSKATDEKKSGCTIIPGNSGCIPSYTPVKFSGYFAGYFDDCYDVIDEAILNSDCEFEIDPAYNLVGGKVTLKYKDITPAAAAIKFADKNAKATWLGEDDED